MRGGRMRFGMWAIMGVISLCSILRRIRLRLWGRWFDGEICAEVVGGMEF